VEAVPRARVLTFGGSAAEFHARDIGDQPRLEVWVFEVDRPAIVLGSTQRDGMLDVATCAAAGVEIVRRRSGGGVVLVEPDGLVWFDVVVPAAVLHDVGVGDDIGASMVWLGSHIAAALGGGVAVHRGAMACSGWCPLVCFGGVGPGEVVAGDRKLVGISQRRTRAGARFQCAVHVDWSPDRLLPLLARPLPHAPLPSVATLPGSLARQLPAAVAAVLTP
jgi:lipoate-protein ligase A